MMPPAISHEMPPSSAQTLGVLLNALKQHQLFVHAHRGGSLEMAHTALPESVQNLTVNALRYDSRLVGTGDVFVALRGIAADGHRFIPDVVARGAAVVVAEEDAVVNEQALGTVVLVRVRDGRKALSVLAHAWYGEPSKKLRVFGVTGTNGKTTTTFILKALLEAAGETVGIIGTTGNFIDSEMLPATFTTPEAPELCALFAEMVQRGATSVAMEVSSHALAQERVYGTTFAGAIFTNLTQDHLDFHKTMEEYAAAKRKLFSMLPPEAIAVVNADDEYAAFMVEQTPARRILAFGRAAKPTQEPTQAQAQAMARIANERFSAQETAFTLELLGQPTLFETSLVGRFNVDNVAGCLVLVAEAIRSGKLGTRRVDAPTNTANVLTVLQSGLRSTQPAPGRMQRIVLPNGAVAIVDYAHTPDALEKALLACRELIDHAADASTRKKLVCVFGCGGNRDRTKRPKMGAIAARLADEIVVTSDNPRLEDPETIIADVVVGIPADKYAAMTVLADRAAAIREALTRLQMGDVALIAGKGHENYQIIGTEKIHFDDVEQAQAFAATAEQMA